MSRLSNLCPSTCLAAFLASSPALAEVSALEVWDSWQALLDNTGSTISFDQSISGGILTINNLVLIGKDHEGADLQARLGSLVLQEKSDGSVTVLLPNDAPIVLITGKEQLTINQRHTDMVLEISGSDTDMTYSYTAKALAFTLVELITDGEVVEDVQGTVSFAGISGTIQSQKGERHETSQETSIESVSYTIGLEQDEEEEHWAANGALTNLQISSAIELPKDMSELDLGQAVKAGFMINSILQYGEYTGEFEFLEFGGVVKIKATVKDGKTSLELGQGENAPINISQSLTLGEMEIQVDNVEFDGEETPLANLEFSRSRNNFSAAISGPVKGGDVSKNAFYDTFDTYLQILTIINALNSDPISIFSYPKAGDIASNAPLPFGSRSPNTAVGLKELNYTTSMYDVLFAYGPFGYFSAAEIRTKLLMPLALSETPSRLLTQGQYRELEFGKELWEIFDYEEMLPREAMTFVWDISGTGNWLVDLFDKKTMQTFSGPKAELHSLRIDDLKLDAAGVDVIGKGAFTFNNDDLKSYDGWPAPIGALDLKMRGISRMIDTLVEIDILPEDEAIAARLKLGVFTTAGDGDNERVTHLEATGDGKLLANGQRLK